MRQLDAEPPATDFQACLVEGRCEVRPHIRAKFEPPVEGNSGRVAEPKIYPLEDQFRPIHYGALD